jgi:hypothetical protein
MFFRAQPTRPIKQKPIKIGLIPQICAKKHKLQQQQQQQHYLKWKFNITNCEKKNQQKKEDLYLYFPIYCLLIKPIMDELLAALSWLYTIAWPIFLSSGVSPISRHSLLCAVYNKSFGSFNETQKDE